MVTSPEKAFLCRFFDLLNRKNVRYAVMRNWQGLPDSLGGSDLDLLTDSKESAKLIVKLVEVTANELGGMITSLYEVEATIMTLAGKKLDGTWWGGHIDIFLELTYFGIPYFSTKDTLDEAIFENGWFYRCSGLGDVVAFLKECLHNGQTKKDYYSQARSAFIQNPELVKNATHGYYTKKSAAWLPYLLEKKRTSDEIRFASRKLVQGLWLRSLSSAGWSWLLRVKSKNTYRRVARIFSPPGYSVTFLGTDGAGKSAIISKVTPFLSRMMHQETIYEHMRPNFFPSIARLFGRPLKEGPTTDPHASKPSGFIGSLARLLYYSLDYIFGYWFKVYPVLIKRPTLYVFDRYYYDYPIDPRRSRISLPRWIIKAIGFMIPQPDLILCLGTNPKVIHARKSELPLEEVQRQVNELRRFCEKEKRAVRKFMRISIKNASTNQQLVLFVNLITNSTFFQDF